MTLKMRQSQLAEEKKSLLQNNEILNEVRVCCVRESTIEVESCPLSLFAQEKEKLLLAVQAQEELLKKEQKKRDQLTTKIKAMESKLLAGNIIDNTDETKRALELKRQEVIEQKVGVA